MAADAERDVAAPSQRHKDAAEAAVEIHAYFNSWTGAMGKYGVQFAITLMAANWALHGSRVAVVGNPLAKWSMVVAIGYLASTLALFWLMVRQARVRAEYVEDDKDRWRREFEAVGPTRNPWPYTTSIERTGRAMQELHFYGPLLSGALLVLSVFFPDSS